MTDNIVISPPTKFVGLHSHSTNGSIFDAIGTPADHIDFARSNGMDALALTDHGNMAGYSFQQAHLKNLSKKGINFKGLAGVEAYFVPSLAQWKIDYELSKEAGTLKTPTKKKISAKEVVGDELFETKQELSEIKDDDTNGGTIIENEEESKSSKIFNPIKARSHLVLLAKNSEGLKGIFNIVSESAKNGFYVVPRIDFDILKRFSKGNIVASSACVAGRLARIIFDHQPKELAWEEWKPSDHNFELIQSELKNTIQSFQEALGEENYYLELQMNKLGPQHLVNMHLIEAAKRTNAKLVVTCDAHYSNPAHWKEREIYKALGWQQMGKTDIKIPESIEELKCELYPKNASQLWETYHQVKKDYGFYDDQTIKDAIERTYDIAHNQIGEVLPDRSIKLPALNKIIPSGEIIRIKEDLTKEGKDASDDEAIAFRELKELAIQGLKDRKKALDKVYIERLKYELDVIKHLKLSKYFLTYYWIMKKVGEKQLLGMGRGSSAGSLLAYVLGITQVDSIEHGLLFERFLSKKKKGLPDIDSDTADREEAIQIISDFFGEENVIPVSNFAKLQLASLCKDLAKLFGVPFDLVNSYTQKMRSEALAKAKQEPGFDAQVWDFTIEEAEKNSPSYKDFIEEMKKYPSFFSALTVLFKQNRTCFSERTLLLTSNGYKTIHEITKEDKMAFIDRDKNLFFNENYSILHQGKKQIFAIELEDSITLELTEDHEVFTSAGIKKVKDLTEKDFLLGIIPPA